MQKLTRSATKRLAILTVPAFLGACSTLQPGTTSEAPASFKRFAENLPRVDNSPKAPCWQQEQIAAQNAYIEGILRGSPRPYLAPCKTTQKPKGEEPVPAPPSDPKTS